MLSKIKKIYIDFGLNSVYIEYFGFDQHDYFASVDLGLSYEGSREDTSIDMEENSDICSMVVAKILEKILVQTNEFQYCLPTKWRNGLKQNKKRELTAKWNVLQLLKEMNKRFGYEVFTTKEIQKALAKCRITYHSFPEQERKRLFDWEDFEKMGWNEEKIKNKVIETTKDDLVTLFFNAFKFQKMSSTHVILGSFTLPIDNITKRYVINMVNSACSGRPSKYICMI